MAAQCKQGCRCNVTGIGAQGDRFYHIGGAADRSPRDKGYVIADSFLAEPGVHGRQGKLHRNAHIVSDAGRRCAGAAAETVDGNDVRAASGDTAGDCSNIMYGGDLYDDGLLILGGLF